MVTFKRDLARARIEHIDSSGRVLDLHALRHTLSTMLAQTGASDQIATEIMRHTDGRLTRTTYTHLRVVDTAAAVEQLPDLDSPVPETGRAIRTGTDDRPIVDGLGKVLTKSTTHSVFLGRSVAQSPSTGEESQSLARASYDVVSPSKYKGINQKQKGLGANRRPCTSMGEAGFEPARGITSGDFKSPASAIPPLARGP